MSDTIAAIATAQAPGGIGIIRISGENAREIAGKVFRSASNKTLDEISGYQALYGRVFDENQTPIDDVIALNFAAPKSYTGEDVVELSCHGGMYILTKILRRVIDSGARIAQPGEFTKRAFLNGKISLNQAESIMDLISAHAEQSHRIALAGKDGVLDKKIDDIRTKLVDMGAHLAAWADYPEDDIPELSDDSILALMTEIKTDLQNLIDSYDTGRLLKNGINTVIVGRPNVGKSTLMNLLSGYSRSIVTDIPGTTRDIVEETVQIGGVVLSLADTAGLRESDDVVENIGVELARQKIDQADLILAMFDASNSLNDEDISLIEKIKDKNTIAIINKSDLEAVIEKQIIQQALNTVVEISANDLGSSKVLETAIAEKFKSLKLDPSSGVISNERQRAAVQTALDCVKEAYSAMKMGMTLDAVTVSLDFALNSLFELTGEKASERVVEQVFEKFCVGK